MKNKFVERIPKNELAQFKAIYNDLLYASDNSKDWANRVGKYYVETYGRPLFVRRSFQEIGAIIIFDFEKQDVEEPTPLIVSFLKVYLQIITTTVVETIQLFF